MVLAGDHEAAVAVDAAALDGEAVAEAAADAVAAVAADEAPAAATDTKARGRPIALFEAVVEV